MERWRIFEGWKVFGRCVESHTNSYGALWTILYMYFRWTVTKGNAKQATLANTQKTNRTWKRHALQVILYGYRRSNKKIFRILIFRNDIAVDCSETQSVRSVWAVIGLVLTRKKQLDNGGKSSRPSFKRNPHIKIPPRIVNIFFLSSQPPPHSTQNSKEYCKDPTPNIYIIPSSSNVREWHGIIFPHKGFYGGGIFKFIILIPKEFRPPSQKRTTRWRLPPTPIGILKHLPYTS